MASNVLSVSGGWEQRAACIGADPGLFYSDDRQGSGAYVQARLLCLSCNVKRDCLSAAMDAMTSDKDDESSIAWGQHGVWGGTSPSERWQMLAERRAA